MHGMVIHPGLNTLHCLLPFPCGPSVLGLPTVNHEHLAGGKVSVRRTEKENWTRQILRLFITLDCSEFALRFDQLLWHAAKHGFGQGKAGCNHIHSDPVLPYFHRKGSG